MTDFVDATAFNFEQGQRARKLFAAVVLAALDDAISDDKKFGNGPEQIARWARSRDGREVLSCAGIDPNERVVSGLMEFVGRGVRTSVALSREEERAPPRGRGCGSRGGRSRLSHRRDRMQTASGRKPGAVFVCRAASRAGRGSAERRAGRGRRSRRGVRIRRRRAKRGQSPGSAVSIRSSSCRISLRTLPVIRAPSSPDSS